MFNNTYMSKIDELLDKKMSIGWGTLTTKHDIKDNFMTEGELTVTITLNEYRNLIRKAAMAHVEEEKLRNEKVKMMQERDEARKQYQTIKDLLSNNTKESEEEESD